ncbi:hypothetical protein L2E82_20975 [Cichorium intybus]|uniref:Uncharacterized protein n=1 Tax=Cichorium intybus TaxID=13427 RepID=A0ACB9DVT5_CICIN|nr:hypothetical protein L2E82_20975 [Cichorium intybus]
MIFIFSSTSSCVWGLGTFIIIIKLLGDCFSLLILLVLIFDNVLCNKKTMNQYEKQSQAPHVQHNGALFNHLKTSLGFNLNRRPTGRKREVEDLI